jgi:hypothetical protein
MENLDLLIEKFKEAKDELQKAVPPAAKGLVADDKARAIASVVKSDDKDTRWAEKMKNFNKAEEIEKAMSPRPSGMQTQMLSDASRDASRDAQPQAAAPVVPARIQTGKMLNELTGQGHAPLVPAGAGRSVPGFEPGATHRNAGFAAAHDVPAGAGAGIPGFERQEITFSKSGQWSLKDLEKGVNTIGGASDDGV